MEKFSPYRPEMSLSMDNKDNILSLELTTEQLTTNKQERWWQQYLQTGEFGGDEFIREKITVLVELVIQALREDNQQLLREIPILAKNIICTQAERYQDLSLRERLLAVDLPVKNMSCLWLAHELVIYGMDIEHALALAQKANLFERHLSDGEIKQFLAAWQQKSSGTAKNLLYSLKPVLDFYHQQK